MVYRGFIVQTAADADFAVAGVEQAFGTAEVGVDAQAVVNADQLEHFLDWL